MKLKFILPISLMLALMLSCSNDVEVDNQGKIPSIEKIEFSAAEKKANDALNAWGSKVFNNIVAKEKDKDCVSFSPLSASLCLTMLANSCDNEMEEAIRKLIGHTEVTSLNSTCQLLMRFLTSKSNGGETLIANSCWINSNYPFIDNWKNLMESNFYSDVYSLDFSDNVNKDRLDKWCSDNTKGLIPKIDVNISSDLVCVLINTLYFQGEWKNKFDVNKTTSETFNGRNYIGNVKMMNQDNIFQYLKSNDYEAVSLKMGKNNMKFILPSEGINIAELTKSISINEITKDNRWKNALVHLSLPKFETGYSVDITDVLREMGLHSSCRFDKMGIKQESNVVLKHKAYTSIDEEGAKIASVTHVNGVTANPDFADEEVTFKLDRPFIYYVHNTETETILMAGIIYNL